MFVKIALLDPDILYFDEPKNHLDMESIEVISKALENFEGTLIIVSHDARLIDEVCDEICVISGDKS